MGARTSRVALVAAVTLWLVLPACIFPDFVEPQGGDDDDDSSGVPIEIQLLCDKGIACDASPWDSVEECVLLYPYFIEDCGDYETFMECAVACLPFECQEFDDCHTTCVSTFCMDR